MKKRSYYENLWREFDSQKSMVMIAGPRQTGKTVLAREIAGTEARSVYFNYDTPHDKARLAQTPAFFEHVDRIKGVRPLVVLDEIHKYRDWKNYLKGIYDGYSSEYRFLITGSGSMDLFHQRGDSLAGRYLLFHMFPFTIGELFSLSPRKTISVANLLDLPEGRNLRTEDALDTMMRCSGFPEPFLMGDEKKYRRWAASYHQQIVRNDIRDAFAVRDIDAMETLYTLLAERVGSPLSVAQLMDPLKVSHKTIDSWLSVLESLLLVFRVRPYHRRISRSILKTPKFYSYDFCRVDNDGKRFENLVAVELKRATTCWTEYGLGKFDLFYLRNKEHEEVDFLVTQDSKPLLLVEAKTDDESPASNLRKFQALLGVPAVQLIRRNGVSRAFHNGPNRILVVSASTWLATLS
jgi:predicted AAA+ superfamily ATPase